MLPFLDPHIRNLSLHLLEVGRGAAEEMPAQKRARAAPPSLDEEESETESPVSGEGDDDSDPARPNPPTEPPQDEDDSDGDGHSTSASESATDDGDEYILVDLAEIRKEVQCPICLGIIRKTRKVMECLHRFCRECIDKSMRLGNNECPACRTHCASRRSLRDDPNFDALIAALFPDIDKYEEEELAFHEEEKNRNKKIQDYIAETSRRQSEALSKRKSTTKATASAFMRKSQGSHQALPNSYPNGRCRAAARNASPVVSDEDEEEDVNGNDAGKDSSSADEPSPDRKPKRPRQISVQRSSPFRLVGSADVGSEENNNLEVNRENFRTSHLQAGKRELSWGKGGARSQTRHSSTSGLNSRSSKAARLAKLMEHLRNLDENEDGFDVHLILLPLDEKSLPSLDSPYVCCSPTVTISHLCQFIAIKTSVQVEEIEIFARKPQPGAAKLSNHVESCHSYISGELQLLEKEESLVGLLSSFAFRQRDLELIYCVNARKCPQNLLACFSQQKVTGSM